MFTTVENVKETTGYDVDLDIVRKAHMIIEAVIGRPEVEVQSPNDFAMIARATEYQAAYMKVNYESVFEQIALRTITQTDGTIVLDTEMLAPYIAPLAMISLNNLSWRRSKSIKTGAIRATRPTVIPWERD